jgi:RNA polymerase sigma-70 factor (ECF subfamily)
MVDQAQRAAFERLVLPHLDEAFNLARWLTGNRNDAEDVVQEAYLKAFKHFAGFRGSESRAWTLTIVRRSCFSWLRANRSQEILFTDDDAGFEARNRATVIALHPKAAETPESLATDKEMKARLNEAVRNLPLHYREIIILREIHDLSYRQIAEIADIPIGTVMSRLTRARDMLAKHLGGRTANEAAHEM